MQMQQY